VGSLSPRLHDTARGRLFDSTPLMMAFRADRRRRRESARMCTVWRICHRTGIAPAV
jgi:hypothetical protein